MSQQMSNEFFLYPWPSDPDLSAAQMAFWSAEAQWNALCDPTAPQSQTVEKPDQPELPPTP